MSTASFLISLLNCFVESLLFRVIRYTALADNIDLDLSRIFQLIFNALGDLAGEQLQRDARRDGG